MSNKTGLFIIITIISILFCLTSCGTDPDSNNADNFPKRITFNGIGPNGIFDPSLTQDPSTGRLWMSYSSVETSTLWPDQNKHVVETRLAWSDDQGSTWTDTGEAVNSFLDVILLFATPDDAGTWHNEVSKLVYDPGANVNERWKLFWHHYLLINGERRFDHGWIAYKSASTAEGLKTADEIKLFSGSGYDPGNDILGGNTRSPVGGAPKIALDTDIHSDLNNCIAFSEPGAHATDSALYLSIFGYELDDNRLVLLKCDSPNDPTVPESWNYIGSILNNSNAAAFGYLKFSASELFKQNGQFFLMVSPVSNTPFDDSYNGCFIFRFTDIDAGILYGAPDLIKSVSGTPGSFNGACGYHKASSKSGFIYSEVFLDETDIFRIFQSGENL